MNKKYAGVFAMSIALLAANAYSQDVDMSIRERIWPPVSNGVAFIDGKYIPPPYVISRREGEIYLNGIFWDWTIKWPPKKKLSPMAPPKEMPSIPQSITEQTTPYDKDYIAYISDSRQYLVSKYGENLENKMMIDVYNKLPCIKSAKLDPRKPDRIILIWINGEQYNISVPPPVADLTITKEQAEKYIDSIAEIYVRGLGENRYYYVMGKGDKRQGMFGGFQGTFGLYARALRASKDEAEFLSIMKTNQPTGGISETWLKLFYSHKDDLPKWESRLLESDTK